MKNILKWTFIWLICGFFCLFCGGIVKADEILRTYDDIVWESYEAVCNDIYKWQEVVIDDYVWIDVMYIYTASISSGTVDTYLNICTDQYCSTIIDFSHIVSDPATTTDQWIEFPFGTALDPGTYYIAIINDGSPCHASDITWTWNTGDVYPAGDSYRGASIDYILQIGSGVDTSATGTVSFDDSFIWSYPLDDYYVSNQEFTDWEFYLNYDDFLDYTIIRVNYCDVNNVCYLDVDLVTSTTTDLFSWTMERGNNYFGEDTGQRYLPEGRTTAWAELLGTNLDNCDSVEDFECIWYTYPNGTTDSITYTVDNDGYNIFHIGRPTISTSAFATSTESEESSEVMEYVWTKITNMFPFAIIGQIVQMFNSLEENTTNDLEITLGDFLPEDYHPVGSSSPVLKKELLENYLPIWSSHIYPLLNNLVYIITFGFILIIIMPRIFGSKKEDVN